MEEDFGAERRVGLGGRGRGRSDFKDVEDNEEDEWRCSNEDGERRGGSRGRGGRSGGRDRGGFNNKGDNEEDSWGCGTEDGERRGGGRGRGRGGFSNRRDKDDQGGFGDGDGERRGGRGRGRGRGGFSRGGDSDGFDGSGDQSGEIKEPAAPERYVPPELPEGEAIFDERNLLNTGSGIHFDDYENIPVVVTGNNPPSAVTTFAELGLRELLLQNLVKCKYTKPTPIQRNASPILLAKRDVMACAQTGSGKTAGFLLPILNKLLAQDITPAYSSPATPEALILAPTRELAIQIGKESLMYSNGSAVKTRVTYGGTAIYSQKGQLMGGCNILVATPGRLKQFINEGHVSLEKIQFFILDEADRMLDMGFMPDVQKIVESLPPKEDRVSGMFSATFPDPIQRAAEQFLNSHIFIAIGVVGGACKDVAQSFIQCERNEKRDELMRILEDLKPEEKCLVFCASKKGADFLAAFLSGKNVSSTSIHGDRLQRQREDALREFTNGTRKILVATSVAARGLDIPKVSLVVNYDLPSEIDEYVHRIGRTGRVGHSGKAISFYDSQQDSALIGPLVSILKGAGQEVPDFLDSAGADFGGVGGGSIGFASTDARNVGGAPAATKQDDDDDEW